MPMDELKSIPDRDELIEKYQKRLEECQKEIEALKKEVILAYQSTCGHLFITEAYGGIAKRGAVNSKTGKCKICGAQVL